jgi:putative restriction endonuclease
MESIADADRSQRMSGAEFRAFLAERPGRERWELLRGVPTMLERPTLAHNIVASNLQHLLLDALENHDQSLLAVQRAGLHLPADDHHLESDVSVIDADYRADQYAVERAYLVAEIASDAGGAAASGEGQQSIDLKRRLFRNHEHCRAIALVREDRMEVALDVRERGSWVSVVLRGADARLSIPSFGLRCFLADLYERTPLSRRPFPRRT